ncbi:MAG: hypothetical protein ACK5F4_00645 [Ignavibacteria bacterium]|jgi:hypothetical protein
MIAFIISILLSSTITLNAGDSNLDTVYLEGKKAWYFYGDYQFVINNSRKNNLNVLLDNDPKAGQAFYIIDGLVDDNVNPECVTKPLLMIGVNPNFIPRYKLHFLQQMTGRHYPPGGVKMGLDSQIPDNVMFVVNKITKMLVYMKSTTFEYSDNRERNVQVIDSEILKVAQIHMDDIKRFGGYVYKPK